MENTRELEELVIRIERLMEEMIEQQRSKVVMIANRIQPGLSDDDLRDPHSFPQVSSRPEFAYEDGLLAGLIAAQVAVMRDGVSFVRKRMEGENNGAADGDTKA